MNTKVREANMPEALPPGVAFLNSIEQTKKATGWSRSSIYLMLAAGELRAKKDGARVFITGESIAARVANLPDAVIGKPKAA